MKLVKMLTPPIKASVIVFAFLAALSARANSSFDWTGEEGVVTIPAGVAAEVLDEDIAAVEALTSIVQADKTSRILFKNTQPLVLNASISGPGGNGKSAPNVVMDAASVVTFNGDVFLTAAGTYFTLANCTVNAKFGANGNYYYVTALAGCTVNFTATSQIVRRYIGYFYGPGAYRIASRFPYSTSKETFAMGDITGGGKLIFDAEAVFATQCVSADGSSLFDLNGFNQSTKSIFGGSETVKETPSLVTVTSATPATLTLASGAIENQNYIKGDHMMSVIYTGAVSVDFNRGAAYTNHYMNGVSTTTGDLNVLSGTCWLDGQSQWAGPQVNVSGGRLVVSSSTGGLSSGTDLALSGTGVVEVPAGNVLRVKSVTVDGQDLGLHGITSVATLAAAYPGFFEGAGAISTMDGDPRAELSAAMSVEGLIAVEDVTSGFAVDARGGIAAATGEEVTFAWEKSPADTTTYAMTVKAADDAEVSVYVDGGDTPVGTVTAADGAKQVTFSSAEAVRVRLAVAGETGSARVYGFANEISAKIYAPKGGVNVTGANVGTNYVAFGEPLSFTIARVFDSDDRIASGLNVNGKFIAFDDLPDATFAWTVDGFDTSVIIETVYDETTYYVDDEDGDDDKNNGRHPTMAFKTIKKAMGKAVKGSVIYVAEGVYGDEPDDEVMGSASSWSRVVIPEGVTLKASGSRENTIILGKKATEPFTISGYSRSGTDSARCVQMEKDTRLEGFTLTGGCATTDGTTHTTGGGVLAANVTNCRIVNCIISNNYAVGTASAGDYGRYLRCLIANNKSGNSYGHGLRDGAKCYNCYFKDQADGTSGGGDLLYSTFACGGSRPTHSQGGSCVGCVFNGNAAPAPAGATYRYVLFTKKYHPTDAGDETCKDVAQNGFGLDSGARPSADSVVRNFGEPYADYLTKMLAAGWTEEEASLDFAGNPRCLDGRVDAGCCEYDCRGEMATMLDPLGFLTVASVAPTATMGDDLALTMPAGASLDVDWAPSVTEGATEYSFDAEVSGEAVLEAYLDGADEPYAVVREADGKSTVNVVKTGDAAVRLVVRGESGEAKVSKFVNAIYAIVLAPSGGISIDGAQFGTNYVAQGSSLTFTLQRKFDSSDVLATGATVNGEYVSFDEHPEGVTLTVNSKATSVRVDAVYADSLNEVYVNDASGSDSANYGRHPANPFKTIKKALELAKSGDTVYVAPGVYGDEPDDEVMGGPIQIDDKKSAPVAPYGYSRIWIPAGVTVKATGTPQETVIVGRKATEALSGGGCGSDSARCAYFGTGARLIGFTLTGGYSSTLTSTAKAAEGATEGGGYYMANSGAAAGVLVNCIITNNTSAAVGGAGVYGSLYGCWIGGNHAVQTYGQGVRYGSLYNCYLKETSAVSGLMSVCSAVMNCTIDCPSGCTVHHSASYSVYNTIYKTSSAGITTGIYSNCLFTSAIKGVNTNDTCRVVSEEELALDANGVPARNSVAVDDPFTGAPGKGSFPEYANCGLLGCPRVYNGRMDIGAAEFDWRDTYRGDLGAKRWLAVEAASSNVVETADGAVRLADGSELTLKFTIARLDGEKFVDIPFVQSGAGTLTATLDGAVIEPKDGAFVLKATAAEQTLVLSYSGEGYADFTKMRRNAGVLLIVR